MKKYIVATALLFIAFMAKAQSDVGASSGTYTRAIGIKFPAGVAITYKQFITDKNSAEGQAMFWSHGFRVVGLYEFNFDIPDIEGLRWYAGPGAHVGIWNADYRKQQNISSAGIGIDGVLGLDYKVADLPINVSIDWQPGLDLVGSSGFTPAYGGIGVRYTFSK